jgi:hypothetical protein
MKNKSIALVTIFSIFSILAFGQVTEGEKKLQTQIADTTQGWKTGGIFSVNLAQTSLTNWSAGGQNSVAVNGIFAVFANLKKGKSNWDNSLDLGYGFLSQGKGDNRDSRKTDDKIDFLSKYGRQAYKDLYYAALVNFKTQMTPGWNYDAIPKNKISDLFAPAYLLVALGLDYKPNANFSAFIAPLTVKFTFVTDDTLSAHGAFGVTPGETIKSEFGGYVRAIYTKNDFKGEFMKNISFTTKVDLFSNYADNPQNIDVNWETLLGMKVNKYISVSFNTVLIYDDNIKVPFDKNGNDVIESGEAVGSKVQFKEILGVGFSYKF